MPMRRSCRLLFQKDYGAGLDTHQAGKILGADVNSSSGTEPCTKRSLNEPADVTRGAGFQFAADAKAINPDITIDMLRLGRAEVGHGEAFVISQEHGLRARYRWYKETLDAAYAVYGLKSGELYQCRPETKRIRRPNGVDPLPAAHAGQRKKCPL